MVFIDLQRSFLFPLSPWHLLQFLVLFFSLIESLCSLARSRSFHFSFILFIYLFFFTRRLTNSFFFFISKKKKKTPKSHLKPSSSYEKNNNKKELNEKPLRPCLDFFFFFLSLITPHSISVTSYSSLIT